MGIYDLYQQYLAEAYAPKETIGSIDPYQYLLYPQVQEGEGDNTANINTFSPIRRSKEEPQFGLPEQKSMFGSFMEKASDYAKDIGGRYAASNFLARAGMAASPYLAQPLGIFGLLKGGNLFDTDTRSQRAYDILTTEGQDYADTLYGPGGILQGYNQVSAFGRGSLGTLMNNLQRFPNMSDARKKAHLDAINKLTTSQDSGIAAVTRPGTYAYDDSIINYAPPSGGDSGSGWSGGGTHSSDSSFSGHSSYGGPR